MATKRWNQTSIIILIGLMLLMLITRTSHFGSISTLPDASLAIFFFAGFYLNRWSLFPVFLLEAALIDFLVTIYGGVSSWCITPAYLFLIPTYAIMWEGGRFCSDLKTERFTKSVSIIVYVLVLTSIAFLISNLGFYEFSGRFEAMDLFEYFSKIARYYPMYLTTTLLYSVVILTIHGLVKAISDSRYITSGR